MHGSTNGEGTEQPALLAVEDALSGMKNDLEFTQWYGSVKDELLEASYEKYQCVLIICFFITSCYLYTLTNRLDYLDLVSMT